MSTTYPSQDTTQPQPQPQPQSPPPSSPPPPPELYHIQTLPSPTGITRAWSTQAHPSPRTPLLATASSDKSVQVWDLRDFRLISNINGGHKRSVRCVGWKDWGDYRSSNNNNTKRNEGDLGRDKKQKAVTLATGSFDANVGVWVYDDNNSSSTTNNTTTRNGVENEGMDVDELDMTVPPDEDKEDEEEEWHFTTLLTGPDSEIKDLQFCPPYYGANLLATCSRDKSVWVWEEVEDDNEWETIAVLGDHTGDVKCVGWCSGASVVVVDDKNGEGESESDIVGCREILATGSYDDTIRLWRDVEEEGDWMCVAVMEGHKGTVWDLCWEGFIDERLFVDGFETRTWEPRIVSCSDDMSLRLWRRELSEDEKEKKKNHLKNGVGPRQDRLPSIIRPTSVFETWVQESVLPTVHARSVYAVDWSKKTGLIVSCGGDGTIVVYREVFDQENQKEEDVKMSNGTDQEHEHEQDQELKERKQTKWIIAAIIEAAHDEYEVNHVCWAPRRDKGKRWDGEEVLISTGDDGDVKIWGLPEGIVDERWKK